MIEAIVHESWVPRFRENLGPSDELIQEEGDPNVFMSWKKATSAQIDKADKLFQEDCHTEGRHNIRYLLRKR